jgi:hypothetical protein
MAKDSLHVCIVATFIVILTLVKLIVKICVWK